MRPRQRVAEPLPPIAERIKHLRRDLGLSQEALAASLAVSQQTVSYWERGLRTPDRRTRILLKHQFGCTQEELESGTGPGSDVSQVAEARFPGREIMLPVIRKGVAAVMVGLEGLASEALDKPQAQRLLREALRAGRPVWIVLGATPK